MIYPSPTFHPAAALSPHRNNTYRPCIQLHHSRALLLPQLQAHTMLSWRRQGVQLQPQDCNPDPDPYWVQLWVAKPNTSTTAKACWL
jgi:hypothetical protein